MTQTSTKTTETPKGRTLNLRKVRTNVRAGGIWIGIASTIAN